MVTWTSAQSVQGVTLATGAQNRSDEEHPTPSLAIQNTLLATTQTTPLGHHVGIIRLRLGK